MVINVIEDFLVDLLGDHLDFSSNPGSMNPLILSPGLPADPGFMNPLIWITAGL